VQQLSILFLILIFFSPRGDAATDCAGPEIVTIQVPLQHKQKKSKKISYKFQFVQKDSSLPIVIVVGGGPGQATMSATARPILGAFPENANLIYTDPRSVGCNDSADYTDDSLTSYNVSADIAAIVSYLAKNKFRNYYLYGASFGTQAVTQATYIIEKLKLPQPKAAILEGVGGHHYVDFHDYFKHFQAEWNYVKANELSEPIKKYFEAPLPVASSAAGFSSRVWGQFVASQVILGYIPQPQKKIEHLLQWYLTSEFGVTSAQEQLAGMAIGTNDGYTITMSRLFKMIACQEIFGEMYMGRDIQNGQLIAFGDNLCAGLKKNNPYDSKKWPLKIPIYYFQGERDPTTTLAHAQYHFDHQNISPKRFFLNVKKSAHAPLSITLKPCAGYIWNLIFAGGDGLEGVLNQCGLALGAELDIVIK